MIMKLLGGIALDQSRPGGTLSVVLRDEYALELGASIEPNSMRPLARER